MGMVLLMVREGVDSARTFIQIYPITASFLICQDWSNPDWEGIPAHRLKTTSPHGAMCLIARGDVVVPVGRCGPWLGR